MVDVTYIGPFDAVEFEQGAVWRLAKKGESISVPDRVAESLLEQTDNWQRAKKSTTKKEPASAA
jgi:hypothetical protein